MSSTMTIRLDDETKSGLVDLALATHRTRSFLAAEAIRNYVALNEWQIQEIGSAIKEADAGDFATEEEVSKLFDKWSVDGS